MVTDSLKRYLVFVGMALSTAGIFTSVIITYTGVMYREEIQDLTRVRQQIQKTDPALYEKIENDDTGQYNEIIEKTFVKKGNKPMIITGVIILILQVNILVVFSILAVTPGKTEDETDEKHEVVNLSEENNDVDESF